LIEQAHYPPKVDLKNFDYSNFSRLRESIKDVLDIAFGSIHPAYLDIVRRMLSSHAQLGAAGWTRIEAAIFAIQAIASALFDWYPGKAQAMPGCEEVQSIDRFLTEVFTTLLNPAQYASFSQAPLLAAGVCALIVDCSFWFLHGSNVNLIQPALSYTLAIMRVTVPHTMHQAVVAFKVSLSCRQHRFLDACGCVA